MKLFARPGRSIFKCAPMPGATSICGWRPQYTTQDMGESTHHRADRETRHHPLRGAGQIPDPELPLSPPDRGVSAPDALASLGVARRRRMTPSSGSSGRSPRNISASRRIRRLPRASAAPGRISSRRRCESLPPQPAPDPAFARAGQPVRGPGFQLPGKGRHVPGAQGWVQPLAPGRDVDRRRYAADRWRRGDRAPRGRCRRRGPQPVEEYADNYYNRYSQALNHWRTAQITGNAYAGTIRSFLNDPRLAEFTPEEVSRAYQRVFGRDLKTDLEADRARRAPGASGDLQRAAFGSCEGVGGLLHLWRLSDRAAWGHKSYVL